MRRTVYGTIVAYQEGQYKQMVIKNLDELENSWDRYIMMTICPNWQGVLPKLNDTGYIEFEEVKGGDNYFRVTTGNIDTYKYSGCYFLNFIKEPEIIESKKEFKF